MLGNAYLLCSKGIRKKTHHKISRGYYFRRGVSEKPIKGGLAWTDEQITYSDPREEPKRWTVHHAMKNELKPSL